MSSNQLSFARDVNFLRSPSCTIELGCVSNTSWTLKLTCQTLMFEQHLASLHGVIQRSQTNGRVQVDGDVTLKYAGVDETSKLTAQLEADQKTSQIGLKPILILPDCQTTLTGNITISNEASSAAATEFWHLNHFQAQSLDDLSSHFKLMLDSGNSWFSDVILKCGDVVLPAHKSVLSVRSPVFAAMFNSKMREAQEGAVVIDDLEPSIVKAMLDYMYTGKTGEISVPLAFGLLFAADKYQIQGLKDGCSKFLRCSLSNENVLPILVLGDRHDVKLKYRALEFICNCDKFSVLEGKEEWKTLLAEKPNLAIEVLSSVIKFQQENTVPGSVDKGCN